MHMLEYQSYSPKLHEDTLHVSISSVITRIRELQVANFIAPGKNYR